MGQKTASFEKGSLNENKEKASYFPNGKNFEK